MLMMIELGWLLIISLKFHMFGWFNCPLQIKFQEQDAYRSDSIDRGSGIFFKLIIPRMSTPAFRMRSVGIEVPNILRRIATAFLLWSKCTL